MQKEEKFQVRIYKKSLRKPAIQFTATSTPLMRSMSMTASRPSDTVHSERWPPQENLSYSNGLSRGSYPYFFSSAALSALAIVRLRYHESWTNSIKNSFERINERSLPSWKAKAPSTNSSSSTICDVARRTSIVRLAPLDVTAWRIRNRPAGSLASLTAGPQTLSKARSPLSYLSPLSLAANSCNPSRISIWDRQLCNLKINFDQLGS